MFELIAKLRKIREDFGDGYEWLEFELQVAMLEEQAAFEAEQNERGRRGGK